MVIGQRSTIKPNQLLAKDQVIQRVGSENKGPLDSLSLTHAPAEKAKEGEFFGRKLVNQVLKWSSRQLPTNQVHLREEEKQQILDKIQPGDVVLTYHSHRPNLGHLEYWATGTNYTHCALYEGHGRIIETLGNEVLRSPFVDRLSGPIKLSIVRPKYKNFKDRADVIKAARALVGTPYDARANNKDQSELYCSELIEVAMKKVDKDLDVPDVRFFGREVTAPDGFLQMSGAELIHDGKSEYWCNQLHQWPLHLGAVAGASVGALVGGPFGAVVGMAAGFEGTLAAMRYFSKESL